MSRARLAGPALVALGLALGCGQAGDPGPRPVTFARDVAPVLYAHCSGCHRPGGSGPFVFLTYDDARKRARQIAEITASGTMPPWQPVPGYGEFVGARGLTPAQVALLQAWADAGAPEGDPADLPPAPVWSDDWELGPPDLEVEMSAAYTLAAGAGDVFRNFVLPVPLAQRRYVRALELRPGNPQVVHHAVMMLDRGGAARARDAEDPEPGFGGMDLGQVQRPGGHFLGWAPGTTPYAVPDSLAWQLDPGADMVLQLHLQPTGKPETLQARVGLYFSQTPPTRAPLLLRLGRKDLDIPAGEAAYRIEDTYYLPVDVEALSVYPHAHYLGKAFEVTATLPDGRTEWLLKIDDWDFNWQDAYRYRQPVPLPRGTAVTLRLTYDNSADNPRNPHDPPRRVRYGTESTDEMGDLVLQVLPRGEQDAETLRRDYTKKWLRQEIDGYESLLAADPGNPDHHQILGAFYMGMGDRPRAVTHLQAALQLRPDLAEAHLNLATLMLQTQRPAEAEAHLRLALESRPGYGEAHLNLGMLLGQSGRTGQALAHLDTAAALLPNLAADIEDLTARVRASDQPRR